MKINASCEKQFCGKKKPWKWKKNMFAFSNVNRIKGFAYIEYKELCFGCFGEKWKAISYDNI